ncbi:MAG: GGDEF domain-containing protein [Anaerolineales bacterium]|nr:GGDEF domain-containing protein [Anaerolineales bacterium]
MDTFITNQIKFLDHLSLPVFLAFVFVLTIFVGWVDLVTGFEFSLSFLYLIPVIMIALRLGLKAGLGGAVLEAGVWLSVVLMGKEPFSSNYLPYWNAMSRGIIFTVVALLVAELRRLLDFERSLARIDPLTGVLNRRAFYQLVFQELTRIQRYQHPATLLYMDVDDFKQINDQFGHHVGDQLLECVAKTISKNIRAIDAVARLGGDEFAILMPETGETGAKTIAPRLYWHLRAEMVRADWPVTFSMGVMTYNQAPQDVEAAIHQVDQLMYEVKRSSKDGIAYGNL